MCFIALKAYQFSDVIAMSDDEADPELLELLRQSLGLTKRNGDEISSDTGKVQSTHQPIALRSGC